MSIDWSERIGRRVKLRDLHILLAVVRAGSMGRAAQALAISQPVVSKAIAQLEQTLGVVLLDRTPQGVEPTAQGRALIDCGIAVFDELRKGVAALEWLSDPASGHLRIGCTEPAAAGLVPAAIERFTQRNPQVTFSVIVGDARFLAESALPSREVDIAIGAMPHPTANSPIASEVLFDDRHVVMTGRGTPWTRRRRVSLAQLVDEAWVLPPPSTASYYFLTEAFAAARVPMPRPRVECFSIVLTQQLLASGRFLAMLPLGVIRLGRYDTVQPVDVDWQGAPRSVGIMTLGQRTRTPLTKAFVACVREMAAPIESAMRGPPRRRRSRSARA